MLHALTTKSVQSYSFPVALSILHSPEELMYLNPLVVSFNLISSTPEAVTYGVTDSLTLCGFIRTQTRYTATFRNCDHGVDVETKATMGIITRSRWRVDEDSRVVEEGELEAPSWLMAYVHRQWSSSHQSLMGRLEEKLTTRLTKLTKEISGAVIDP